MAQVISNYSIDISQINNGKSLSNLFGSRTLMKSKYNCIQRQTSSSHTNNAIRISSKRNLFDRNR